MTREQIEKAAIKFAKSHYLDKYGNMNAEITEDEFDALVCSIAYMFMYGAQWRINSVWHDRAEKADTSKELILMYSNGSVRVTLLNQNLTFDGFLSVDMFIKWAYVSDLLPERKEETK